MSAIKETTYNMTGVFIVNDKLLNQTKDFFASEYNEFHVLIELYNGSIAVNSIEEAINKIKEYKRYIRVIYIGGVCHENSTESKISIYNHDNHLFISPTIKLEFKYPNYKSEAIKKFIRKMSANRKTVLHYHTSLPFLILLGVFGILVSTTNITQNPTVFALISVVLLAASIAANMVSKKLFWRKYIQYYTVKFDFTPEDRQYYRKTDAPRHITGVITLVLGIIIVVLFNSFVF